MNRHKKRLSPFSAFVIVLLFFSKEINPDKWSYRSNRATYQNTLSQLSRFFYLMFYRVNFIYLSMFANCHAFYFVFFCVYTFKEIPNRWWIDILSNRECNKTLKKMDVSIIAFWRQLVESAWYWRRLQVLVNSRDELLLLHYHYLFIFFLVNSMS